MSCPELTAKLVEAIGSGRFDLVACNIANPDMVGHSGDLQAAIQAAEAVDVAIGALDAAVRGAGGALGVTADNGTLDRKSTRLHSSHSGAYSTPPSCRKTNNKRVYHTPTLLTS